MEHLASSLARILADHRRFDVPDAATDIAKIGFIDTIGTMLAGRSQEVVRIIDGVCPDGDEASVLMGRRRTSARDAALINATAGHVLDYDDVAMAAHPSVVLVPALLAEAERLDASGAEVLRAYVVGYEVWAELFERELDPFHAKGWHPTATLGTVGVAAAVAFLNSLDEDRFRNALAISASLASGVIANFGSMMKSLQAGRAAAHGIDAVNLARAGITASDDALDHPAGLLAALSPAGRVDRIRPAARFGVEFRINTLGLSIKRYPVCYAAHRIIDGVIALVTSHDLKPGDIRSVRITTSETQAATLRNHAPITGLEAKFSMEHAVAAAVIDRNVGLAQLSDSFVARGDVRKLYDSLRVDFADPAFVDKTGTALSDSVAIETTDGRVFESGAIPFVKGSPRLPLSEKELLAKFLDCAASTGWQMPENLVDKLLHLESIERVRSIAGSALSPGCPGDTNRQTRGEEPRKCPTYRRA
jgi:aconitate decarboxylase